MTQTLLEPDVEDQPHLDRQFAFLDEAGRLKSVVRSNCLIDLSRQENSAEHSWHLALYAMVFEAEAPTDTDVDAAIRMLLLHDIVEVDAGDHPIHENHDKNEIARRENAAAARLFGLLPDETGREFGGTWQDFEARETATARYAAMLDHIQPVIQTISPAQPIGWHRDIAANTLLKGRALWLKQVWPALWSLAAEQLDAPGEHLRTDSDTAKRLEFLKEADRLKTVLRATPVPDPETPGGQRPENSGEHSWHIALYALTLADQAGTAVDINRVVRMLLIHDIVEIDAGDAPIHGNHDPAEQDAKEQAAADRLFGLLPPEQAGVFRALWDEFETAVTPDAIFAKSIDRVQPILLNMASGGGSWKEYNVTLEQLDTRIGVKVAKGAPEVWTYIRNRVAGWFDNRG